MKKTLHLTVFLVLTAALVGGALAFANNMTVPIIATSELTAEKETLKEIYSDVSNGVFVKVKDNVSKTIEKISEVEGKGHTFKMKVTGYKGGTSYLVTLNEDGSVYDYVAISNGDTQGLGSKVTEKSSREPLKGKDAAGEEILDDTIAEATVSSKPVIEGIREAAKYQAGNLKQEVDEE